MISFFRVSTVYKYVFWLLLLLALRLPVILGGIPILNPELKWVIVAEQMHKGFFLYTDIWDNMPPLAAFVYWFLYAVAGHNFIASHLFATFLIGVQALFFNQMMRNRQVYNERTMLPAVLYVVFMSLFIDFYVVSPPLLANTVLMIVVHYIFLHLSEKRRFNAVFEIGAYTGIATLFYFPSFTFLIVPILTFLLYTPTPVRDYLLMLVAFFFTLAIAFLAFFLTNSEYDFWLCFFYSHLQHDSYTYLSIGELLTLILPFVLLLLLCWRQSGRYHNYNNYQDRCQTAMYIWFWVGLVNVILSNELTAFSFMPMMLAVVFAFTHFCLQFSLRWVSEVIFLTFISYALFFTYTTQQQRAIYVKIPFLEWANWRITLPAKNLLAQNQENASLYKGKKVWVSGYELGIYKYAKPATPYLNEYLAQRHLANLSEYNILATIYYNFQRDLPDFIIDQNGKVKPLFERIPLLAKKYTLVEDKKIRIYKKL